MISASGSVFSSIKIKYLIHEEMLSCLLKYVSSPDCVLSRITCLQWSVSIWSPRVQVLTSFSGTVQMIWVFILLDAHQSGEVESWDAGLIHINILEFPLELASWLDAIKIKSINAAHTSAGSHLLYCRKQDNPFVWWKSFTTFPQFLLCSTEVKKFSCNLLEKKKQRTSLYRGKKAAVHPTKAIAPDPACSESQWKEGHTHSFMLYGWTCCPRSRANHQS